MVTVTPAPPALSGELELFHTTDPLLYNSPVLVFYGPAATIVSASSRIQVHVFTPAGLESYARLAISPSSPYYAAVNALPREEQGDEVIRGIAFGLSKYFAEIPKAVRDCWTTQASGSKKPSSFGLFGPAHIAVLASRMTRIEDPRKVIENLDRALGEQSVSWLDLDVVLPKGATHSVAGRDSFDLDDASEDDLCKQRYGKYAPLVRALGDPAFLPTSKLKRAPSKPTAVGRSQIFQQSQKETVRKEMCELVDTEESYVQKLTDLVKNIARDLKAKTQNPSIPVTSPAQRAVSELFPASLDRILEINGTFLNAIRSVLDTTEESAISDIQKNTDIDDAAPEQADAVGIMRFAKCLLEHLPDFAQDYSAYMTSQANVHVLMRQLLNSSDEPLVAAILAAGEQRLMSALIEPIQRLPRYTLYIDTMSKQLPVGHPALKVLLKARDIVSDICSQDASGTEQADVEAQLQNIVYDWPEEPMNLGRLVSILDTSEVESPYEPSQSHANPGLTLLFTHRIIILDKSNTNAMSARALLAELEKPGPPRAAYSTRPRTPTSLHFVEAFPLGSSIITECLNGQAIGILPTVSSYGESRPRSSVLMLEGPYAGKASRLCEEVARARVEGRFSETERESGKWEVRSAPSDVGDINLFSAVFEESKESRDFCGNILLVFEPEKLDDKIQPSENGPQTIVSLRALSAESWQITIDSILGVSSRDKVTEAEFLPTLTRRLIGLLQAQSSVKNSTATPALVLRNQTVLKSLQLVNTASQPTVQPLQSSENDRIHRPLSPVKMLSNFLASTGPGTPHPTHHLHKKMPVPQSLMENAPSMAPPVSQIARPQSKDASRPTSKDQPVSRSEAGPELTSNPVNPSKKRLDDTLNAYLLALQARKGNIVGKVVKARVTANELSVNELYNSLLEDPNMMVVAAQSSVDVLFSAFEKFLNVAWKEQAGPVIPRSTLNAILDKAESLFPVDFERFFKDTFHNLAPQNQRALRGIVKLLAELLDGTGNDGDRGVLTAAFAELLVPGEDPYTFVSLIDRFVDDIESLFGETIQVRELDAVVHSGPRHERARSVNTGSLTSNTSSLRKKFGFGGLSRENSKSEQDTKVGSVWRTLSKSKQSGEQPSSISRGTMQRAKSTDIDTRMLQQKRPSSQDRPAVLGAFTFERPPSQDTHSFVQNSPLMTIGENPSTPGNGPPRKKRRSSLSDLKTLDMAMSPHFKSPPGVKRLDAFHPSDIQPSPTPSITKVSTMQAPPTNTDTPTRNAQRSRLPSSFRMEYSPGPALSYNTSLPRPRSISKQPDEVSVTTHPSVRRNENPGTVTSTTSRHERAPSATPIRTGLSERPTSGNAMKLKPASSPGKPGIPTLTSSTMTPTPTKKLRMQSPQKLRERLQTEQRTITTTRSSLETELSKISDELTSLGPSARTGSIRAPNSPHRSTQATASPADLAKRITDLETRLQDKLSELSKTTDAVQADLNSSLTVSESKARNLDELYREANAENEALYARFNDELGRVLKAVRGGEGVEELRKKVREGAEEAGRLRRENARLKREVLGLRSQLRE